MTDDEDRTPVHGAEAKPGPTRQGLNAAGPGDAHGAPPDDAPGPWGTGERPFQPKGGKPARDPDKGAAELLADADPGPRDESGAGPEAAAGRGRTGDA